MEENNNFDIIEEEVNEEYSNDDLFNITSFGTDPSVRELVMQYQDGDIEKPELQRKYVWTKKNCKSIHRVFAFRITCAKHIFS